MSWRIPEEYYVYIYLNEDGAPYYVGMGKGRRYFQKHIYAEIPPREQIVIEDKLTEEQAWAREIELIALYGRKNLNTGPLLNLTPGGMAARSGWNHSEESRRKISEGLKGKKRTAEQIKNYKGTTTPEWAEKIRQARLGVLHDQSRKDNIAKTMKNKKWFTNGTISVFCEKEKMPDGFRSGRHHRWGG